MDRDGERSLCGASRLREGRRRQVRHAGDGAGGVGDEGRCGGFADDRIGQCAPKHRVLWIAVHGDARGGGVHTAVGSRDATRSLDDESFRCVECRIVSGPCRLSMKTQAGDRSRFIDVASSPGQRSFGSRRHRSMPSRRTSDMNPVRSSQAPARNGIAPMRAPSSYRMSVSITAGLRPPRPRAAVVSPAAGPRRPRAAGRTTRARPRPPRTRPRSARRRPASPPSRCGRRR